MEQTDPAGVVPGPDRLLGLACPVAAFSTFPLVWRFVEALPPGQGRPVFLLATMGGMAGLLAGPMHGLLTNKGYHPVGVRQIVMPDNYLRIRPAETCAKRQAKGRLQAEEFARALLAGRACWNRFCPVPYPVVRWLWRRQERFFFHPTARRFQVDPALCTGCGRCAKLCPVDNIRQASDENDGQPMFKDHCQICLRCVAFCPTRAIIGGGPGRGRYRAVADLFGP